jgi:hypothetical protein
MRKIFKDDALDQQFREEGYIVVSLLDKAAVNKVKAFYEQGIPADLTYEFTSTHFSADRAYKKQVNDTLREVFTEPLKQYLNDYTIRFNNFMVKHSGENSRMPLHADWTYVDESRFTSLAVWCPLVDTDAGNGMLGVVPKSHQIITNLRGPKIPAAFNDLNEYIIENFGKLLPMKAGEAVIYDHRMLHFSHANLSGKTRVAATTVLTPDEAEIYHYCILNDPANIEIYEVKDADFYVNYEHFQKPENGEPVKQIPNPGAQVSKDQLDRFYGKASVAEPLRTEEPKAGIFSRLKNLFTA